MLRPAVLAVTAVLVLAGCGAPDYGGHDSDANNWPKSDESSSTASPVGKSPSAKPTQTADPSEPPTAPASRLPENLVGVPLEPRSRAIDDVVTEFVGDVSGLAWDGGIYVREGGDFGLGLFVFTGKPPAIDELDRFLRSGSVTSVGRSACGTLQARQAAPICWRSAERRLVWVLGIGEPSHQQLAGAVDEAWAYVNRHR
ncbi:hypothetical protein [Nocardioides speluncae]|uniref:hypothetical protein n=1 Tax=Nocardioides speluncae TaxID=2670337 RepID=UPI000D698288|nr:hypothetical protein [Nocardioides speluncae]